MGRKGAMLAHPFESRRLEGTDRVKPIAKPYLLQPKLNGDRARVICRRGCEPILLSSEENIILSCPHIIDDLKKITETVELDGEIYHHGLKHEEIRSIKGRTKNLHPDYKLVEFHVFDIVAPQSTQQMRLNALQLLFDEYQFETLKLVPTTKLESEGQIWEYLEEVIRKGYEGFILRDPLALYVKKRSMQMLKFKPRKDDFYVITNTCEEISINGVPKDSLGALTCCKDGEYFNVGSGSALTKESRKEYWKVRESLIGKYAHVKYQYITPGRGVPKSAVLVDIVSRDIVKEEV